MKDRVTYASQILYVGPTGAEGSLGENPISGVVPAQLHHINYIEHTIETENAHVYNYGNKSPVGEAIISPVDVELEFQYNLADAQNEKWLGFNISDLNTPFISGFLNKENDSQNFYILTTQRGDAVTKDSQEDFLEQDGMTVTAFGNAVIENYTIEASLNSLPSASVKVIADNIDYSDGADNLNCPNDIECNMAEKVTLPAPREDDLETDSLRPAYLNLYFASGEMPQGGYLLPQEDAFPNELRSCSLDSFEINLSLPRRISQGIGKKHAVSKHLKYPAEVEFSCHASTKDIISGSLMDIFCAGGNDVIISMDNPYTQDSNINIRLKDIHLDSQVAEHSLLAQEFVNLTFSAPLGGPSDSEVGIYMSGVACAPQETHYGTTTGQLLSNQEILR